MKYSVPLFSLLIATCISGCKKDTVSLSPLASLNIVNASVGLGTVKVNFTDLKGLYSSITTTVAYGGNTAYGANAGVSIPVTIVPADTTKTAFSGKFTFDNGGIYSFYLAGQASAVDTILVKENIPSYTDSSFGVRFINLSYNSSPITVTLTASPAVAEFSNLAYKQMGTFKKYAAATTNKLDTFQVRDAATNAILATYPFTLTTTPRFFNCTLAWKGMVGGAGANALGVMRVNNY